jgi:23S rRNA pseudouridine2457 synthase
VQTDLIFNKPYGVLSQFSGDRRVTLARFIDCPGVYPVGRLDHDSEGLMLLSTDGALQHRMTDPRFGHPRTYWAEVEGTVHAEALRRLAAGVEIQGILTRPAEAREIAEPVIWERDPPVRFRKSIPTAWIELTLREGRNRQVRRMTAAVGLPTLRLIRAAIGPLAIAGLPPGEWRRLSPQESRRLRQFARRAPSAGGGLK